MTLNKKGSRVTPKSTLISQNQITSLQSLSVPTVSRSTQKDVGFFSKVKKKMFSVFSSTLSYKYIINNENRQESFVFVQRHECLMYHVKKIKEDCCYQC